MKGKVAAQQELYVAYRATLFSLSLKYCRNIEEAEDNLHNAFIEIFTGINRYQGSGSFEGWMKRITINKAIESYKKMITLVPVKDNLPQEITVTDEEMNVPAEYILQLVQALPDQYRLAFCLYELDDYSHKEIAAMLGISEGTSKSNLHRAKALLKQKLEKKNSVYPTYVSNGG
ncbi:RNA polymerase sigma factor [Flavobacterium sp. RHBU_3]|uniref:RNA polymerase sigma factor n=1 Tax=Flavobacterium sp. RHBU_3 TaxID=3391184 RepID=UPI003984BE4C